MSVLGDPLDELEEAFAVAMKDKPQFGQGIYKDGNPKTQFGAVKPGLYYVPPMPLYEYGLAHMQGALKYGHYNWRDDPVSTSTYADACKRHIDLYLEGQKNASDTGIHNLAHAMCCLSIIMDAEHHGTLIDDRKLTILYTNNNTGEKLEAYMEETKDRVTKIKKEWTGHAEAVKSGNIEEWKKRNNPKPPVPDHVYFSGGNFYERETSASMGDEFYHTWASRAAEFRQER